MSHVAEGAEHNGWHSESAAHFRNMAGTRFVFRNLGDRLGTLETWLDTLQRQFEERLPEAKPRAKRGWKAIVGTFADDPLYEEAMRLGRTWRETQFDEAE
jgi:hypothetical protein